MDMYRLSLLLFSAILTFSLTAQDQAGQPQLIKSIFFGGGSYYIDAQQIAELEEWLLSIPNLDECEIEIHSHTDNIGSIEYNQFLSQMRSEAAIHQLERLNISRKRIMKQDFGELSPVYDNSQHIGRLHNRRVDIIIKRLVS